MALSAALLATPAGSTPREAARIPFAQRYHAVQHGGIATAANSAISCRSADDPAVADCRRVRHGGQGANSDFDMFYSDVDKDPHTYNSTRAELTLPEDSQVSYARLYWGANLRVGEQKPPKDNGRVLIAEQGGEYKEVLADTRIAHRTADGSDAFQASADVTPLIRSSGSGRYTVAQVNVARGRSAVGAWGGWTLVVAYRDDQEPKRQLALWDGFEPLGTDRQALSVTLPGLAIPPGAAGRAGVVAYDGDRSVEGDAVSVTAGSRKAFTLSNSANPANNVMNSTITDFGRSAEKRQPAYVNTLGYDSDVFDLKPALSHGGDSLRFHFSAEKHGYFLGALFVQADSRR
ncbi:DUF3344 domain-containing protein [Streptomyces sp. NPDC051320]|uniref:DUF3344 domain-containing protein n=1 Tax=Streptomyces sp. NPDC051320 TaxID=3154644 RepID=UPI00343F106D